MPNSQAAGDAYITHRVGLEHYSNGVVNEVMRHLSDVEADVTNALLRGGDIRTKAKLKRQLEVIHDLQREGEATLRDVVTERFGDAVIAEAEFLADYYSKGQGVNELFEYPSAATLVAAALSKPLANKHLKHWIRKLTNEQIKEIDRQVTTGVTLGESIPKIVARIQGSIDAYGKDSVWARSKVSAEAFVRTGVSHVANQAHKHFIENNPGVFAAWIHISVLDNRTSRICEGLAGHVYDKEDEVQWPPLHPNCRSTIIGVPKGTNPKDMGFDTFGAWLKRQTPDYVDQILGPARAKLYRTGKLSVDRFWNNKNHFLTIDELKARNKAAWKRAFPANDR